jgi:uncharacterized protein with GYD domain
MKFVAMVKVSPEGAKKYRERGPRAAAKARSLGLKIGYMYYTQGPYDIVEILDAPSPEAMMAHALWYKKQGYGTISAYPVFERDAMPWVESASNKKV